ncbi:MAG: MotA/TolQ/ExbB proton channel family protein [Lachnospiraceae bacterium]|nr:MotA/TolQ/ExbB proton channel family protein [Lachnospiraceae bacterium]
MNPVFDFLSKNINVFIVILGVILGILLIGNYMFLVGHQSQVEAALNLTNEVTLYNTKTSEFQSKTTKERVTPDTVRGLEKKFNEITLRHSVYVQLIPLFPLFGILGTVAGLIYQINAISDASQFEGLISSLNLSLYSTFWGLVFAIILKVIDALLPARTISSIELLFEDYDKKLSNSIMLGNITSEEETAE